VHRLIRHRMFAPGRQRIWSQPIRSLGQSAAPSVADRIVGGGQSMRFEFRPSSGADSHRWHGQSVLRLGPPIPGASVPRDLNPHVSEGRMQPKANAAFPVNSQLGADHERGARPVDPVDDDRVRGIAG
jgi:hypothetical protein